jgi:hypothetical protein
VLPAVQRLLSVPHSLLSALQHVLSAGDLVLPARDHVLSANDVLHADPLLRDSVHPGRADDRLLA